MNSVLSVSKAQALSHYDTPACMLSPFSRVQLFAIPWTTALQAPLSMGFSGQKYLSGLPCTPPEDLPNPRIKPRSPTLQADFLPAEPQGRPKNTGVGSLPLLQGIFPTQELQADSLPAEPQGKPKNREWVAYLFSRGSS